MKVVVDTNVIVSALINVNGPPAKILSLILNSTVTILYDNRILFEYIEVLSRKTFGFNTEIINDIADFINHEGEFVNADYLNMEFDDETDKKFYEVYKYGDAQCLITENKKHYPDENSIVNPKEFLEMFAKNTPASTHF